ncbi:hypothetical protein AAG570_010651 [Ranatra chinensis]|uniref:Uncharacterized protein n=1 Tax=Ranatra chinensis TaxID=642074 RepID=A0ABD0YN67_9HEMI
MEDVIRKVTRPQKSVDVLFVPDDCAGKIIKPYGSPGKPTGRRGGKVKTLEKDVSEIRNITCVTRSGRKITSKVAPIYVISEESEDSEECQVESAEGISKEEQAEKPTALFEEGDVAGSQMFGFQTPKRKNALANKASESASKASSEICTPKSDRSNIAQMKTPFSLRTQIKRSYENPSTQEGRLATVVIDCAVRMKPAETVHQKSKA